MEKKQFSKANNVWDCGSALYDSYELDSFKRQLNSAIANSPRSLSMPHLTECNSLSRLQPQPQPISNAVKSSSSKISRPFHKFLRFVFKSTNKFRIFSNSHSNFEQLVPHQRKFSSKDRFFVVYDKSDNEPVLSTIPELPEFEVAEFMPEVNSLVRKSASERFTRRHTTGIGVSCA